MKRGGIIVVSLRGINSGFGLTEAIIYGRKGLLQGCAQRNIKLYLYTFILFHVGESIR